MKEKEHRTKMRGEDEEKFVSRRCTTKPGAATGKEQNQDEKKGK